MHIFEVKHLMHSSSRMRPFIYNCALLYVEKKTKHYYDDRAKILSHRIPVLTSNSIVGKNN